MHDLWKDLTFGSRMLLKSPALAAVLVVTLAFGIAANSVAFSLVNSLFLRPPPVEQPDRLVRIYSSFANGFQYFTVSYPDYADVKQLSAVFAGVSADEPAAVSLGVAGENERLWGSRISYNYFSVLGVMPELGRLFTADNAPNRAGERMAVLSDGLWRRRFNARRDVLGERVILNGAPATVIGVAPRDFHGVQTGLSPELWLPIEKEGAERGARQYFVTARLRPGASVSQARAALDVLTRRLQAAYPSTNQGVRLTALPESEGRVHPIARGGTLGFSAVLAAVAGLVLVAACANIAGILLARAGSRRREVATRLALGTTRRRIVRQLLTESILLSMLGGGLGFVLAYGVTRVVSGISFPTRVPLNFDLAPDWRVLAFSLAVTVVAAILFGLSPAFEASKPDLVTMLKQGDAPAGRRQSGLRSLLVGAQVAVSAALLLVTGLFLRSLQHAQHTDVGFLPGGVVLTSIDLGLQGYQPEDARNFWRRLVERLSALPGVQAVSLANAVPFELNITTTSLSPEGYQPSMQAGFPIVDFALVDRGYFETLRIPLLAGRDFNAGDTRSSAQVAIVNDVLAHQFWPRSNAVGKRMTVRGGETLEVVGVARRGKYLTLGEQPKPFVYVPLGQSDARAMTVLLRAAGKPETLFRQIRDIVRALDNEVPLYNATTMSEHVNFALFPARSAAVVLNVIGLVSLALTALGVYGMLAHAISRRTFEIGVRRALGAGNNDIVLLVVRQTMLLMAGGLAIGIICGVAGSSLLRGLLYDVEVADPLVFGLAPAALLLVSLAATCAPTWRALRIEAARALRYE